MRTFALLLAPVFASAALSSQAIGQIETAASSDTLGTAPKSATIASLETTEQWLGRNVSYLVRFSDMSSADAMYNSIAAMLPPIQARQATQRPITLALNISLCFADTSFSPPTDQSKVRHNLRNTISGLNDRQYIRTAQLLKQAGFTNAILRLGVEFDGSWIPWYSGGNFEDYIAAFRHVHDVFKSVCPTFIFNYNGTYGFFQLPANAYPGDTRTRAEASYPGDGYVDVIGLDIYDRGYGSPWYDITKRGWNDPERTWKDFTLPDLLYHRTFAISKGKPVSFPEWGVQAPAAVGGANYFTGGDDPVFIKNMYNWMQRLPLTGPGSLMYQSYFNWVGYTYSTDPSNAKFPVNQGPTDLSSASLANSAAMYAQLYGARWAHADFGNAGLGGSSPVLDQLLSGQFVINGSGTGLSSASDGFHFAYQSMAGDGQIVAQITSVRAGQGLTPQAYSGVMIRQDLSEDSSFAFAGLDPHGKITFVTRSTTSAPSTASTVVDSTSYHWVKLLRNGDTFTAYKSPDGISWTQAGSASISMPGLVQIGLAVTSGDNGWLNTSTFTNVRVDRSASDDIYPFDANYDGRYNYGFTSGSIGAPGSESLDPATGTLTINASGSGFAAAADSFAFTHQTLVGNGQISARIAVSPQLNTSSEAGVMIRETLSSGSKSVLLSRARASGCRLISRTNDNSGSVIAASGSATDPCWLKLVRNGTRFNGYQSADGISWTLLGTADVNMGFASAVEIGLAASSYNKTLAAASTFDNIRVERWNSLDVGSVGIVGRENYDPVKNIYVIEGSGSGVGGKTDSFRFLYQKLDGDCEIASRVQNQQLNLQSAVGLMMRSSLSAGSKNVLMSYAPATGFLMTCRSSTDAVTATWQSSWLPAPCWLKLQRHGNLFLGFKSTDGIVWTFAGQYNVAMPNPIYVGLAVSSGDSSKLNTGVFDNLKSNPLSSSDIGSVPVAGSDTFSGSSGLYALKAGGTGITAKADSFRYLYRPLTGDGQVVARIVGASQYNPRTSEGVMIRETLAPGARMAMMSYALSGGFAFLSRAANDANVSSWPGSWSDGPYWVKLVRRGNVFTGYKSPDGVSWTQVGYSNVNMPPTVYIGLAASAADATRLNSTAIDNVSITLAPYIKANVFF